MACGISLQKLCLHNWSEVNSFMWYIISIVMVPYCLALAEREERREQVP